MRTRPSSVRLVALACVGAALAAAPPPARAATYTFLGALDDLWTNSGNWQYGLVPMGSALYDDEVHLGLATTRTRLASAMNLSPIRLGRLAFDQGGGVDLTGNALRFGGGGTISVTSAAAHTMSNAVVLNDNAAATSTLTVDLVTNASLAASGVWSGAGALVKTGAGTLALSGANTYAGGTTVSGGTLLTSASSLPGNVSVGGGATLQFDQSGAGTFSGAISGAGGLLKTNGGTLTLSGANAYAGGTTIVDGTVRAGADNALGAGDLTLLRGSLDLNGHTVAVRNVTLLDAGAALPGTVSGAGTLALSGDLNAQGDFFHGASIASDIALSPGQHRFTDQDISSEFSGTISGPGGLDLAMDDGVTLSGHSTYTGATNISEGDCTFGVTNALPTTTALTATSARLFFYTSGPDSTSYSQTVGSLSSVSDSRVFDPEVYLGSATLTVGDATSTTFGGDTVGSSGSLIKQGTGTLTFTNTFRTANTTVNGGRLVVTYPYGTYVDNATLEISTSSNFSPSYPQSLDGSVSGAGSLVKSGAGTLALTRANLSAFTGGLRVDGGTLAATADFAGSVTLNGGTYEIAQAGAGTFSGTLQGAGTFLKSGIGTLKVGSQSFSGTTVVSGGGLAVLAGSTFESDAGFSVANGATVTLSSPATVLSGATYANAGLLRGSGEIDATFSNAAGGRVALGNADTLALGQGANANVGTLAASGGTLFVQGGLANSGALSATGGTVEVTGATTDTGSVSGHGSFAFDGGLAVAGTGSLAASGATTDVFGNVNLGSKAALSGSVYSSGRGTLTFHGDVVDNAAAFSTSAGSATVFLGRVSGASSFSGNGLVEFDGGYSPGNSPAAVAIQGDLALGAGDDLTMELGGAAPGTGYDHLTVLGTASLGGTLDVVDYGGFSPALGESFDLFDLAQESGTFSSVTLPTLASGLRWDASALYTTGVIRVQSVPEPAALLPLGLGALALLRRRRKARA